MESRASLLILALFVGLRAPGAASAAASSGPDGVRSRAQAKGDGADPVRKNAKGSKPGPAASAGKPADAGKFRSFREVSGKNSGQAAPTAALRPAGGGAPFRSLRELSPATGRQDAQRASSPGAGDTVFHPFSPPVKVVTRPGAAGGATAPPPGLAQGQTQKDDAAATSGATPGAGAPAQATAAAGAQGKSSNAPAPRSNATVTGSIHTSILTDPTLSPQAQNVGVLENNGKVTLTGSVSSQTEMNNIVSRAAGYVGAGNVVNDLTISQGQGGAQPLASTTESRSIQRLIVGDPSLSSSAQNTTVSDNQGKITLSGTAQSQAEKQSILSKAAQFVGPGNVVDQIAVSGPQ